MPRRCGSPYGHLLCEWGHDNARRSELNSGKLELEFLSRLPTMAPDVQGMCHLFFLNINPTSGAVKDFLEAGQQRLGLTSTTSWQGLEGAGLAASGVITQVLQRPVRHADQIDQAAISRHATAYREQIAFPSCRRVLIVPHSQGICTVMHRLKECLARYRTRRPAPSRLSVSPHQPMRYKATGSIVPRAPIY